MGPAVQVQHFSVELAPDLRERAEPGRVGGQGHQRGLAAAQLVQQRRLLVDEPVVLDQDELVGLRLGHLDRCIAVLQRAVAAVRPVLGMQLLGGGSQTARAAPRGVPM